MLNQVNQQTIQNILDVNLEYIIELNVKDFKKIIQTLDIQDLIPITLALKEQQIPDWQEKTYILFQSSQKNNLLIEILGVLFSYSQYLVLLEKSTKSEKNNKAIANLLQYIPYETLKDLLRKCEDSHLFQLKKSALAKAIEPQLSTLTYELIKANHSFGSLLFSLVSTINSLPVKNIERSNINKIKKKLEIATLIKEENIELIDKTLTILWNIDRSDLIDKLSHIKEKYHLQEKMDLGCPKTEDSAETGLYEKLTNHLNLVFGNEKQTNFNQIEPSIEALKKLSVLSIQDYLDIGILPKINTSNIKKHKFQNSSLLTQQALSNLQKIGLDTIENFKESEIYSKSLLKDYIKRHRKLLCIKQKINF